MEKTTNRRPVMIIVCTVIIALALIAAAFLIGRQTGSRDTASAMQANQDEYISWYRGELMNLLDPDEPIYVSGHQRPDSDAVCSAILYARLLRELGYDAQPVVLGEINNETRYILQAAGVEAPPLLEDASGKTMVLVDHSDYLQSADGLEDAKVVMIIDHHGAGSVTTGNQLIYDARPYGSTATIIGMRYHEYGVAIDRPSAILLAGAILSDTSNLKSTNTTPADAGALGEVCKLAGIEDADAFYQGMYKALISYEGETEEEIFFSDYKEYEADGILFAIACVQAYDEEEAGKMAERMKGVLPSVLPSIDTEFVFIQVSVYHDDLSMTYLVPANEIASAVLEEAFAGQAFFDGTSYVLKPGISRRQILVPAITDVLKELQEDAEDADAA